MAHRGFNAFKHADLESSALDLASLPPHIIKLSKTFLLIISPTLYPESFPTLLSVHKIRLTPTFKKA
jgi:hypothetical protein